jgi:hypothetical protein
MDSFNQDFVNGPFANFFNSYTKAWETKFGQKYVNNQLFATTLHRLVVEIRETHPLVETFTHESILNVIRYYPGADPRLIHDFETEITKYTHEDLNTILLSFVRNTIWFMNVLKINPKTDKSRLFGNIALLTDGVNKYLYYLGKKNSVIATILKSVFLIILNCKKETRNRISEHNAAGILLSMRA